MNEGAVESGTPLEAIVRQSGLQPSKAQVILDRFSGFFALAAEWERQSKELAVTDASQTEKMKMAREGRLLLKQKRVEVENTRRLLKEDALREGQTIDGIAKTLTGLIAPIETYLSEQENFVEIQKQKQEDAFRVERTPKLRAFGVDPSLYNLGRMPEVQFESLLHSLSEAQKAEEKKRQEEEAKRIEQEKENQRIREDNERLKKENEAKERERRDAEANIRAEEDAKRKVLEEENRKKLEAERRAREELEEAQRKHDAEVRRRMEEEETRKKAEAAAERKARRAPDKVKLTAFVDAMEKMEEPVLKSVEAQEVMGIIRIQLSNLVRDAKKRVEAL